MKVRFFLRFNSKFGQQLWISGNTEELGNSDPAKALLMDYLNEEFWQADIEIKRKDLPENISYKYILKNEDGETTIYQLSGEKESYVAKDDTFFRVILEEVEIELFDK